VRRDRLEEKKKKGGRRVEDLIEVPGAIGCAAERIGGKNQVIIL